MGESGEEKIAEVMTDESAPGVKTVLKKAAEKGFIFRKGDHTIADVAGRKDAILAAQTAGAATVIGHGNDRGEVGNGTMGGGVLISAAYDVFLEAAEER